MKKHITCSYPVPDLQRKQREMEELEGVSVSRVMKQDWKGGVVALWVDREDV